jgi:hypothetical protein
MAERGFSGQSFLWRLLFALLLVGVTYNPEGYSYSYWAFTNVALFGPEQAVVGVLLLIGWVIYLQYATGDSPPCGVYSSIPTIIGTPSLGTAQIYTSR